MRFDDPRKYDGEEQISRGSAELRQEQPRQQVSVHGHMNASSLLVDKTVALICCPSPTSSETYADSPRM